MTMPPDLEASTPTWRGSATSQIIRWRARALAAEEALSVILARPRPPCACPSPDRAEWLSVPWCRRCGANLRRPGVAA
jgi:hypothetical protein